MYIYIIKSIYKYRYNKNTDILIFFLRQTLKLSPLALLPNYTSVLQNSYLESFNLEVRNASGQFYGIDFFLI